MLIYYETYGCSHNKSDTEWMKKTFYKTTNNIEESNIIVLNTCAVKQKTITNLKKRIKELRLKYPDKKIVVGGCFPIASKKTNFAEFPELLNYSLIAPHSINKLNEAIKEEKAHFLGDKCWNPELIITGKTVCVIPISTGCLNTCSFCQTKLARGKLKSYSIKEIVTNIELNYQNGSKIFYLASQDNGCYGYDINTNLVELLLEINKIKGDFFVRVGMANPQYVKNYLKELVDVMKEERFFKFLHIPVQSGSNKVLEEMNRGHSVEDFIEIVKYSREKNISISTDIIVGYPTEKLDDFKETINLLNNTKPDVVNRSKFSKRPGTPAEFLKSIKGEYMKQRSIDLDLEVKKISLENNLNWVDWIGECIVESRKKKGTVVCRNMNYKPIMLEGNFKVGDKLKIKIIQAKTFHLIGELAK